MYTSRYRPPPVGRRNPPARPEAARPSKTVPGIAGPYNPGTPRRIPRFQNPRFPNPVPGHPGSSNPPVVNPPAHGQPASVLRPRLPVRNVRFPPGFIPPCRRPQPVEQPSTAAAPRVRPLTLRPKSAPFPPPVLRPQPVQQPSPAAAPRVRPLTLRPKSAPIPPPERDDEFFGPPEFPIDMTRYDMNDPYFLALEAVRQMNLHGRVPWRCLRATRFVGTDKNFEELLTHFGIEEPFINQEEANERLNYSEFVWAAKTSNKFLKEDMIFKTREGYEDWVGVQTHGETEYFRRKKIEQRQRRNTVAEREKRDEQYRLMLLRQEREEAERRRMEEVREQGRRKEEASRNVSVRSYSSGYNRGSSYRTPASICSRTSSQIVRLRDPPSEPSIRYFRSDFSLIGSPADRNRYGRMLPLKLKLMVTLMFNPAGIQMRNIPEFYDNFWNETFPYRATSPTEPNEELLSYLQTVYSNKQIALFDAKDLRNVHGNDEFASDRLKVSIEIHRQMTVEHISCDTAGYSHEEMLAKKKEITDKNKAVRDVLVLLDQCVELFKSGFYVEDLDLMMRTIFRWDIVKTKVVGLGITCASVCKTVLSLKRQESHITHGDIVSVLSDRRLEEQDRYSDENRHPMLVKYLKFFEEIDADSIYSAFEIAAKNGIIIVPENEIGAIYFRYTQGVLRATTAQVMVFIRENMYNFLGEMQYVFPTSNPTDESSNGVYLFENEDFVYETINKRYPKATDKLTEGQRVHIGTLTHMEMGKVMLILAENIELRDNLDIIIRERVMKGHFKQCTRRQIVPGMPVIACFDEKYWSRAIIRGWSKKSPENVVVLFVDYGEVVDMPLENIAEIEKHELAEPPLALCYRMAPSWKGLYDDKAVAWLRNLTHDRPDFIIKKISSRGEELSVELIHCDTNYDITKIISDYGRQVADRQASPVNPPAELPSLCGGFEKMSLNNRSDAREVISLGSECSIYTIKCSSPEFMSDYEIELSYVRIPRGVFISNHMLMIYKMSCSQDYQFLFDDLGLVSCENCSCFTRTKLPFSHKPHEQMQIEDALLGDSNSHAFLLSIDEILDDAKHLKRKDFLAVLKDIKQQVFIQKTAEKDPYDTRALDDGLDVNGNEYEVPVPDAWL